MYFTVDRASKYILKLEVILTVQLKSVSENHGGLSDHPKPLIFKRGGIIFVSGNLQCQPHPPERFSYSLPLPPYTPHISRNTLKAFFLFELIFYSCLSFFSLVMESTSGSYFNQYSSGSNIILERASNAKTIIHNDATSGNLKRFYPLFLEVC